jgi:tetratricopeptide (TPR) repeat protein
VQFDRDDPRNRLEPEGGSEQHVHPQPEDYLRAQRPETSRAALPITLLVLLAAGTVIAFMVVGPPVATVETAAPASTEQPHDGELPVGATYQQNLARLEAAVDADPRDTVALAALAEFTLAAHQVDRTLTLLDRWLEIAPESATAMEQKVIALASAERFEEALEVNRIAYDLDPSGLSTRLNMAAIYANLGDSEAARAWWNDIIAEDPGSEGAMLAQRGLDQLDSMEGAPRS